MALLRRRSLAGPCRSPTTLVAVFDRASQRLRRPGARARTWFSDCSSATRLSSSSSTTRPSAAIPIPAGPLSLETAGPPLGRAGASIASVVKATSPRPRPAAATSSLCGPSPSALTRCAGRFSPPRLRVATAASASNAPPRPLHAKAGPLCRLAAAPPA